MATMKQVEYIRAMEDAILEHTGRDMREHTDEVLLEMPHKALAPVIKKRQGVCYRENIDMNWGNAHRALIKKETMGL